MSTQNDQSNDLFKYEHANSQILQYVLNSGIKNPVVLDVGCWTGMFGEQLKSYVACQVDGIDINRKVLEIAKQKNYRHVYYIDLNYSELTEINQQYDFIIFGDILEHTIDPDRIINQFKAKLNANGLIAVSLPNIGFISCRVLHLLGYWEYKEYGIMDKTHLRFFTLRSMKKFFKTNNLKVIQMNSHVILKNRHFLIRNVAKFIAKVYPSLFSKRIVFLLKPYFTDIK